MLKKDLISSPGLWRLTIELHNDSVDVTATPLLPDQQALRRQVPMNKVLTSQLAAFEELIYDNPLLLADFHAVEVLIDTPRFTFMPAEMATAEVAQAAVDALWPDSGYRAVTSVIDSVGEALVMAVDQGILSFVTRTYPDAPVRHPMEVMVATVAADSAEDIVAELREHTLRVVAVRRDHTKPAATPDDTPADSALPTLAVANIYDAPTADDAAYYILAAAQTARIDLANSHVTLVGDSPLRDALIERLSRFTTVH